MSTVDKLLDRLEGVKRAGPGKWMAKCPAHDDRNPSFAISEGEGGRIVCRCFAGCSTEDALAAVGLTFSDLFPERTAREYDPTKPQSKPPRFSARELLRTAVHESTLIFVAMSKINAGKTLTNDDFDRVAQAMEVLNNIRREVAP